MKGVRALMLAAAMVFLAMPPGAAVAMDAHHGSPLHRPAMILTDAHHAALVVHAGGRPLVVSQTFFGVPAVAAPSSHSTRFRAWLDPAVVCIALLGLIVGALLICRTRILQTRSVNALWDEMVTVDEHKLVDADQPDPVSLTRTSSYRHPHQPQPELSPQSRQV